MEAREGPQVRGDQADRVVTSLPYGVETGPLLTAIGDIINGRKLPQLIGVADESDEKHPLRIVLEIKPGSDPRGRHGVPLSATRRSSRISPSTPPAWSPTSTGRSSRRG